MAQGVIKKEDLYRLLSTAAGKKKVYAPIDGVGGIEFAEIHEQKEITLDYSNSKLSPKSIFFPQREVLCTFADDALEEVQTPKEALIVFGIRPCDALSLTYLDKVFSDSAGRFKDPYYLKRRENAVIISLACKEPRATCFCTSVGGSPSGKEGADILVYELADKLLFESCSDRGQDFMKTASVLFKQAEEDHKTAAKEQAEKAKDGMPVLNLNGLKERVDKVFEDPLWDEITRNCLGCGACTYLCPTCHCFDITDEENRKGEGYRIRTWDSCQYPLFTLHASGHNPRVNKKQRMRQRIMHKYSYTVDNYGDIFCVGCGRCILYCPVNLDIRDMLNTLNKL